MNKEEIVKLIENKMNGLEKEQIEFRQLMGEEAVQRKSEDNYIEVLNNYNYMENSQMKYELLFEILEDIRIGKHN